MSDIKQLTSSGFRFKKSLGQNFITDTNLLNAIVADACVGPDDHVIEVGAGAGTLTRALADKAGFVTAFEVDQSLAPVLEQITNYKLQVDTPCVALSEAEGSQNADEGEGKRKKEKGGNVDGF
ncbi:MAG: hypothetical protein FWD58_04635, partial [Firmicutes bacterium]|nr:hypothetical protein [Bacillota bacterium]